MLARIVMAAVASCAMCSGAFAWDGARAYHLVPQGQSELSLTGTFLHAEQVFPTGGYVESSETGVVVLTPSYRHAIDLFGNAGSILIGLPIGGLSTSLSTMDGNIELDADFAQGDMFVGGVWGLVGSPSLPIMDYVQYKPGFRAGVAAKLFLPTGDYDSSRSVNLWGNRWSLQASLPISYVLGDSMVDPNLMTFEIVPGVQIFGDNDDPTGGLLVTSQDPIFGVEGHVTRNFGNSVWAAVDAYYETGGETSEDGVAQGDGQDALALGATLGLVLNPSVAMRLSYRHLVYSSVPDTSADTLEVTTSFLF